MNADHGPEASALERLAERVGIIPRYLDQSGREWRETSDETRRDLLAAMGFDVSTDDEVRCALERLEHEARTERFPPVRVVEQAAAPLVSFNLGDSPAIWRLDIEREDGGALSVHGAARVSGALDVPLPEKLPLGYHRVTLWVSSDTGEDRHEQTLIVVPSRAVSPQALVGSQAFGLIANLYTLRSATNWGVGDFTDLGALAEWGAAAGADFVGVNPLHVLLNRGQDVSPYSPVSRLFRNPLYIDVTRVPELALAPEVAERIASPEFAAELEALRSPDEVRYDQVIGVKGLALDALHRVFEERVKGTGSPRDREYEEYVERRGTRLNRFATWMALAEHQARLDAAEGGGLDWRRWPDALRDVESAAVAHFAATHESRVDYHRWLQFEADRQLGDAAARARHAGMRIGLYQDLAIGSSPAGADTWAFPDLFVSGVSVGAPPDPYSASGQDWGLPPMDPRALRRSGYRYFIDLVRAGFRHGGALRIDHVMGLFRLFWIPQGKGGSHGAYVRYPSEDLLGIIALESARAGALVVGEDLGTVPEDVPPALERWGVLSSRVMFFERDHEGFKRADRYPYLALATANTHDMPTITGFWEGRDIDVRRHVGLLESDDDAGRAREEREHERHALIDRLRTEGVLPGPPESMSFAELRGAIHAFLARTPSALVGLAVDDLAGEIEPVNVPGVGADRHPSWTRKMRMSLETLAVSPDVRTALRCDGRMPGDRP